MTAAQRAAAAFSRAYGEAPAGLWAAPGRVNLIGEHTDYNDGFALPYALPHCTVMAAGPSDTPQWTVHSEQTGETVHFAHDDLTPGRVTGWASYVAGVVYALRSGGHVVPGAHLAVASDVPPGAGLSSSAAMECAVLTALADLGGLRIPVGDRPAIAQRAENEFVGMPCGIMDQAASTLCRAGYALFLDCRSLAVEHIPFDLAGAGLAVLVVDTRAPHRHVTGEYAARRTTCERAASALGLAALRDLDPAGLPAALARLDNEVTRRRVRHVVTENQRVLDTVALLKSGRPHAIGPLLTASHESLRYDFEVTVPELDTAVEAALGAGAYGARIVGADAVAAAVAEAFSAKGFAAPAPFVAWPGPGARRL
jgi:galactokinase